MQEINKEAGEEGTKQHWAWCTKQHYKLAGEHQVDYGASSSSNESEGEGEDAKINKVAEVTANAMPPLKPPSEDGQEPLPPSPTAMTTWSS